MRVKQYLTSLLKLLIKYACQAVLDKPVLLTIKNNLVKQYLTSLLKLLTKNVRVK